MARLLLALYLPACLFGSGGFVLCQEAGQGMVLEWALESCCTEDGGLAPAPDATALESSDDCACTDYAADFLLAHRLDLDPASRTLPPMLPAVIPGPAPMLAASFAAPRPSSGDAASSRPELPGAGACPRVLRN